MLALRRRLPPSSSCEKPLPRPRTHAVSAMDAYNQTAINTTDANSTLTDPTQSPCCCSTSSSTHAEMDMQSLVRWFTVTGVIFGLVVVSAIVNVIIFHRHQMIRLCKRHFEDSESQRQTSSQAVPHPHGQDVERGRRISAAADGGQGFTHLVGQLGYWMRKS